MAQDWQPISLVPGGSAAEMRKLDHHGGAMFVAVVGQPAHPGHDLIFISQQIAKDRGRVGRNNCGPGRHGQCDAALRLFHVIEPVTILRHSIFGIGWLVCRAHQPIAQPQMFELERAQQRVIRIQGHRNLW
jgi:hypothetical protein